MVVAVASDWETRSGAMGWVRRSFRLGGRKPGSMTRVRSSMSRAIRRTRTAARILCRPVVAAANVQAVGIRIRTARSGGVATGNTRATLAAARGSRLGEEAVRGGGEIVVFLSHWRTPEPSGLD